MPHLLFPITRPMAALAVAVTGFALMAPAQADEAVIRKNLPAQVPNLPKIDEVIKGPIPGLWEVRMARRSFTPTIRAST